MKTSLVVRGFVGMFVVLPMWLFLLYSILSAVHPDRLVWFIYWAYVPASVLNVALGVAIEAQDKKAKS